ncbi:fibronectin type III domain-containing protein [Thiocapsa bogorovii]|uniref:fibronectin type III domain-containing protein n=1 Tax=Thiocapsa bogorovii TaxID=521689 RepID=UPI001E37AD64|nr:fibronectin type III domain-containing protein [Thiocapsa bogorovii]UHD18333.1 fibronectin type III domain-containing protein [Thiocapsa bogorovii]
MIEPTATPEARLLMSTIRHRLRSSNEDREEAWFRNHGRRFASRRFVVFGWALTAVSFAGDCFGADVRLTWNPVNDPRAARYQVHFGQTSRTYAGSLDTTQTTVVINGLTPGQLHYFAVRACTQDGRVCSEFSNEVIAAIAADGEALPVEPCWACLPNQGGWRILLK